MDFATLAANIDSLVEQWMPERAARMQRRALDPIDFKALAEAGFTLTGVPSDHGGLWQGAAHSAKPMASLLRKLATVDPSLSLVSAMHPTILLFWVLETEGEPPAGWLDQQAMVFEAARDGHWFGTVASEPGIGGDLMATKATATPQPDGSWRMSGDKFMGSGSGVTSFMLTVAVPEGEELPDGFLLDTRGITWDGQQGLTMTREWDGLGMAATQSHAFRFDDVAVARHGLQGGMIHHFPDLAPIVGFAFCGVIMGILDAARLEARRMLAPKAERLSAFEQTRWAEAENLLWLADQAFDAAAASMGTSRAGADSLHGKTALANLAEQILDKLAQALGGVSLSRSSPFGQWMQDVRALGHLRPPRALSHTRIIEGLTE